MLGKLPFVGRIFWRVLACITVLVVVTWIIVVKGFGYVMQSQDYPGSVISGLIFSYLVHLWLLPEESLSTQEEQEDNSNDPQPDSPE